MEEFNTIEKVKGLFEQVGCVGNDNNYFIAYKDQEVGPGSMGLLNGMENGMEFPYVAALVNQTERGIGLRLLETEGFFPSHKPEKLRLKGNEFIFISNEQITEIIVKKYALLNSKQKKIIIKTTTGKTYRFYANVNEPMLPYHNDNFNRFASQYSK